MKAIATVAASLLLKAATTGVNAMNLRCQYYTWDSKEVKYICKDEEDEDDDNNAVTWSGDTAATVPNLMYLGELQTNLGVCQGRCHSNDDCQAGLICIFRDPTVSIIDEHCANGNTHRFVDYCYHNETDIRGVFVEQKQEQNVTAVVPPVVDPVAPPTPPVDQLVYKGEPPFTAKLRECEGDCDSDWNCDFGLICYKRADDREIPGCDGVGIYSVDYCYAPPPNTLVLVMDAGASAGSISRAGKCEGSCVDDDDCLVGLECFQRDNYESVPGCEGLGAHAANYCYDPKDVTARPTVGPTSIRSATPTVRPTAIRQRVPPATESPITGPATETTSMPSTGVDSNDDTKLSLRPRATPTLRPRATPTFRPTQISQRVGVVDDTPAPTIPPTLVPTSTLSLPPTIVKHTLRPRATPTLRPRATPTSRPTQISQRVVVIDDIPVPTVSPTFAPTSTLSLPPTIVLSREPSARPTKEPSKTPTAVESSPPSRGPSAKPTVVASNVPSTVPLQIPSDVPSTAPKEVVPSSAPTAFQTMAPSKLPSTSPTLQPSGTPSDAPSMFPTNRVSASPSASPSDLPSIRPIAAMTEFPSDLPSSNRSDLPSLSPSALPRSGPSSGVMIPSSGITSPIPSDVASASPSPIPSAVTSTETPVSRVTSRPTETSRNIVGGNDGRNASQTPSGLVNPQEVQPSPVPFRLIETTVSSKWPSLAPSYAPNWSSDIPSHSLSAVPSDEPSLNPSDTPSGSPTLVLTKMPITTIGSPNRRVSSSPIATPLTRDTTPRPTMTSGSVVGGGSSDSPSAVPSDWTSLAPSDAPSDTPSGSPTLVLSNMPITTSSINSPNRSVSSSPIAAPLTRDTTPQPTMTSGSVVGGGSSDSPSALPSDWTSLAPSDAPLDTPSGSPTLVLSNMPITTSSINSPNRRVSSSPIAAPLTRDTTPRPTMTSGSVVGGGSSDSPSAVPSDWTSLAPSEAPSVVPSKLVPSDTPSIVPSVAPSNSPTSWPSDWPSLAPSDKPSSVPSDWPSLVPSGGPSALRSDWPSVVPSRSPATSPSPSREISATPIVVAPFAATSRPTMTSGRVVGDNVGPSAAPGGDVAEPCSSDPGKRASAIMSELLSSGFDMELPESTKTYNWLISQEVACPELRNIVQRFTMGTLFYSLSGWNCTTDANVACFLSGEDECSWDGVSCNSNGDVTSLRLDDLGLAGNLPDLSRLASLVELDMDSNMLSGSLPIWIGQLQSLEIIDFDSNKLTGTIPTEIGKASLLRVIDLDGNQLSGSIPEAIGSLENLYFLQLDFNLLTGSVPTSLVAVPLLEYLSIIGNRFSDPLAIEFCDRPLELFANCVMCTIAECCTACLTLP